MDVHLGRFLDQRTDPVDAPAGVDRAADRIDDFRQAVRGDGARVDRLPPGGLFAQLGDVHVAEIRQHQRARDRRRGQHQHVDGFALAGQREALVHAEAMLLVDDRQRQRLECDVVLNQRMGADQNVDVAGCKPFEDVARARRPSRGR